MLDRNTIHILTMVALSSLRVSSSLFPRRLFYFHLSSSYSTSTPCRHATNHKKGNRRWMQRHVQDEYVQRAQRDGHVSRAVYKLQQMDEKHRIFLLMKHTPTKATQSAVLELGAAPGGWTSYVVDKLAKGSTLIAVDLLPLDPTVLQKLQRHSDRIQYHVIQDDVHSEAVQSAIRNIQTTGALSVVLSDMAANTTGDKTTDAMRTAALCESALDLAVRYLGPGGSFVAKFFSCPEEQELRARAREHFEKVHVVKPKASRSSSVERYLVAKGFKP